MDDEQTPPASEPAPPQNPLSQLLIELSRVFAGVPQTSEDERNSYIMALVGMARFVREAARSTPDAGLWKAQLRLSELAYALRDLGNGQVAPALRRTKRKAGSAPDSSVKWMKRVLVLAVQYALHQSGMTMQAAAEYIGDQRPDLKSLMTRGQSLPKTIQRWRRDVDSAKEHEFLAEFSKQKIDLEETMQRLVQGPEQRLPDWRQVADNMLAGISR